jgi:hypothetical protein
MTCRRAGAGYAFAAARIALPGFGAGTAPPHTTRRGPAGRRAAR